MTRSHLLSEMPGKRCFRRDKCLKIVVAILAGGTADAGPFRMGRQFHRRHSSLAIVRKHVLEAGVQTVLDGRAAGVQFPAEPILTGRRALSFRGLSFFAGLGFALPVVSALEEWIALEFSVHMGRQIKVGKLQQFDGLHQLRRHYQGLRLAEL